MTNDKERAHKSETNEDSEIVAKYVSIDEYNSMRDEYSERIRQLQEKNAAYAYQIETISSSRLKTERLKDENNELRLLLFAFIRNSTILHIGLFLGKTPREITDKTFETIEASKKLIDKEKMIEAMNLATNKENRYERE